MLSDSQKNIAVSEFYTETEETPEFMSASFFRLFLAWVWYKLNIFTSDITSINVSLSTKQNADSDLSTIAGLDSTLSGVIASDGGGWLRKSYASLKSALGLVKADVGLSNVVNVDTTTITNITGTRAQFDAAVTDANFLFVGDISGSSYTNEDAQDAVGTILSDSGDVDFTYDDVTPSISGSIKANSITYGKIQDISAASKLLGRGSAGGAGDTEEISIGSGLVMTGTTLSASGVGGGLTVSQVEQNLGAVPNWRGQFVIIDAAISPSSKIQMWQACAPLTGKGTRADENEMDSIDFIAEAGTGQIIVRWQTKPMVTFNRPYSGANSVGRPNTFLSHQDDNQAPMLPIRLGKVKGNFKVNYFAV